MNYMPSIFQAILSKISDAFGGLDSLNPQNMVLQQRPETYGTAD